MPRKGHSEEQIIHALREAEAGKKVGDICRELGVSPQAFYSWKRRYAGLGLSELRELRQLREENRKLKTVVAGGPAPRYCSGTARADAHSNVRIVPSF
jgi:putative transposase